jgi:hypothetical protein
MFFEGWGHDDDATARGACGRCHDCSTLLTAEDWCRTCRAFRRYYEHGYGYRVGELDGSCEAAIEGRSLPLPKAS